MMRRFSTPSLSLCSYPCPTALCRPGRRQSFCPWRAALPPCTRQGASTAPSPFPVPDRQQGASGVLPPCTALGRRRTPCLRRAALPPRTRQCASTAPPLCTAPDRRQGAPAVLPPCTAPDRRRTPCLRRAALPPPQLPRRVHRATPLHRPESTPRRARRPVALHRP